MGAQHGHTTEALGHLLIAGVHDGGPADDAGVKAGDIVIQRGTNHGWANRGKVPCRIAFILIDGRFDDDLA